VNTPEAGNAEDTPRLGHAAQDGVRPAETVEPPPARPAQEAAAEGARATAAPATGQSPSMESVLYIPLAVTVGDGFKFGCGFFMALVLTMLMGFVFLAALFALTSFMGLNLPVVPLGM
jgi:hypothetical protein